ncbi:MAG: group II intron reverse transcriptase/maturase [Acidobacteria bacterium]|nr:group II intron reverse transcriptase/maturase [Acidobacteriota bacterium]
MLTTLETGVKGGVWYSLIDKVWTKKNLEASWERVKRNKGSAGVDGKTIQLFESRRNEELGRLEKELKEGTYEPQGIKRVEIPKPGKTGTRPLGIPVIRDRVVQTALKNVLEPIFEKEFCERSYGFRPKRSCKDALRRVQELLNMGYRWVVDADIEKYFQRIPFEPLLKEVGQRVSDSRILTLIERYLKAEVLKGLEGYTPEAGTPQGAVISPLLSNIYLHPVDVAMKEAGYEVVRYADDEVVLCKSEEEARGALEKLQELLTARGLTLHPEKTKVVDMEKPGGFDFLGYHFETTTRKPRQASLRNLRDKIRAKTGRSNGKSLRAIIASINPILRGWFEYFKHSHIWTFNTIDGWVRMRLRSILRARTKRKGRGRGLDHQRWPNAFFRSEGLFSMHQARLALSRSQ